MLAEYDRFNGVCPAMPAPGRLKQWLHSDRLQCGQTGPCNVGRQNRFTRNDSAIPSTRHTIGAGSHQVGAAVPIEIERKFLVNGTSWQDAASDRWHFRQAYLTSNDNLSVRVRIIDSESATLTVKLPDASISRFEFEQDIALSEAEVLMSLAENSGIEKTRYTVDHAGHQWTVDCYHGDNNGLVIAEIELENEEERFVAPDWLGEEVTGTNRYRNSILAQRPYGHWQEEVCTSVPA